MELVRVMGSKHTASRAIYVGIKYYQKIIANHILLIIYIVREHFSPRLGLERRTLCDSCKRINHYTIQTNCDLHIHGKQET